MDKQKPKSNWLEHWSESNQEAAIVIAQIGSITIGGIGLALLLTISEEVAIVLIYGLLGLLGLVFLFIYIVSLAVWVQRIRAKRHADSKRYFSQNEGENK